MDHAAEGIARLPTCFRDTNVEDVVTALSGAQQSLEDALEAMPTDMAIDNAEGTQLDGLGSIVGEPRNGADDTTYRLLCKARIRINRSGGRPEDVYDVLGLLVGDLGLELREEWPAAFRVLVTGGAVSNASTLSQLLSETRGTGIMSRLSYANAATANTFTLDGTSSQGLDGGVMLDGVVR